MDLPPCSNPALCKSRGRKRKSSNRLLEFQRRWRKFSRMLIDCDTVLRFIVVSEISSWAGFWPNADKLFPTTSALFSYPCFCRARLHPAIAPRGIRSQIDEVVPQLYFSPGAEIVRTGQQPICQKRVGRNIRYFTFSGKS